MVSSNIVQLSSREHEKEERASGASRDRLAGRTYNVEGVRHSVSRSRGEEYGTTVHWITMADVGFCTTVRWKNKQEGIHWLAGSLIVSDNSSVVCHTLVVFAFLSCQQKSTLCTPSPSRQMAGCIEELPEHTSIVRFPAKLYPKAIIPVDL